MPDDERREILGLNLAGLYGFDVEKLKPIADRIGPTVEEMNTPLERWPEGSTLDIFMGDLPELERSS